MADKNSNKNQNNSKSNYFSRSLHYPDLKDYIPVLLRGKWIIVLTALVVLNIAFLAAIYQEPEYHAEVSVFINTTGRQASPMSGFFADESKNIANEIQLLRSRMIAEAVADRLMEIQYLDEDSLEPIPVLTRFDEQKNEFVWLPKSSVTSRVRGTVSFALKDNSDFIAITTRSNNNREAALIANTYAQVYYDRSFHLSRQQSRNVREFLEQQLATKGKSLEEAEEEFREYMEVHGVVRIDDETQRVINQISQLEAQRESTEVEIQSLNNTLVSLKRQLEEEEPKVAQSISAADNSYIRMIQEQIAELEVERDLTLTQHPEAREDDRYRYMIDEMDGQLAALRENLRRRSAEFMQSITPGGSQADPAGFVKQLRQRILEQQIQLQGLEFKRSAINETLQRYERQFNQLPQVNMEYARLQRARTSTEKLYLMLEERYNEALISEQSEFGSVDIIDEAQVPASPVSPDMRQYLLLGLFLGVVLGAVVVVGRDRLYGPIRIPEDLKKNGYSVLTAVSSMHRELKKISKNGFIRIKGNKIDTHLIMLSDPISTPAESFRLLRAKLQHIQTNQQLCTIIVTSPSPGDGKTTVVANLGISYAQEGKRVLLIDGDLRKPALATGFDQVSKPGLTDVLSDEVPIDYAVQKTAADNLYLLASGTQPEHPAGFPGMNKMSTLLHLLSGRYDIILIDSPPVLAASDAPLLSRFVDGVIMVAASDRTKMKELNHAHELLQDVGSRITGVVLNFFDYRRAYGSSYVYGYRYGRYGDYYNGKDGRKQKAESSM